MVYLYSIIAAWSSSTSLRCCYIWLSGINIFSRRMIWFRHQDGKCIRGPTKKIRVGRSCMRYNRRRRSTNNGICFSPSSDKKGTRKVTYPFWQQSPIDEDVYISYSLSSEKFPTTTSFAMRMQANFRLSEEKESPMILFDQNCKMYT